MGSTPQILAKQDHYSLLLPVKSVQDGPPQFKFCLFLTGFYCPKPTYLLEGPLLKLLVASSCHRCHHQPWRRDHFARPPLGARVFHEGWGYCEWFHCGVLIASVKHIYRLILKYIKYISTYVQHQGAWGNNPTDEVYDVRDGFGVFRVFIGFGGW